jgi:hypothetical protein
MNPFSQIKFEAHIELPKSLEMNDTNKYEWMLLQAKECETISLDLQSNPKLDTLHCNYLKVHSTEEFTST